MSDERFVGISNASELRKSVLLSSKDIIQNLQRAGNIRKIREEKMMLAKELNTITMEIGMLMGRLKKILPTMKGAVKEEVVEEVETTIGDLQTDLDSVENALKNM